MNAEKAAKAIVHWLEYEYLCGRSNLLSEASLTTPIGEFLISTQNHNVKAELRYPGQGALRGRPREMDFALLRRGEETIAHMIESKWITADRDFKQEIFDDLLRLESAEYDLEEARWLIVAGTKRHLFDLQGATINDGGNRVNAFNDILPFNGGDVAFNVRVADNDSPKKRRMWKKAAGELGLQDVPLSMTVKRVTDAVSGEYMYNFMCIVWQIQSVRNRATRRLDEIV